jgi:two-component system, LytTR family, response regulator
MPQTPPIRTLIVDDEPLAREGLRVRLARESGVEIVGEAIDGDSAIEPIQAQTPDLVFLDVQMPGMRGFDVLERVSGTHLPVVIFVTAYDQYALKAFDVHALDYLLKPFSDARFAQALDRARQAVSSASEADRDADRRVAALLAARADARPAKTWLTRLPVKDRDRFLLLRVEEITWIEAAQNYVQIHARKHELTAERPVVRSAPFCGAGAASARQFLVRCTMADLEAQLDPAKFSRIHRSALVNLDRIREIRPAWHGDFDVILEDGTQLKLSRHYRDRLLTTPGASDDT